MPDYTVPAEDIFMEEVLTQLAVYWHPAGLGNEGQKTFEAPIEITCRWENITEVFLLREGGEARSRAKVMCDRDLAELGVLWIDPETFGMGLNEGDALAALEDEEDPFENDGAFEIRRFDKLPDFDGEEVVRTAYL